MMTKIKIKHPVTKKYVIIDAPVSTKHLPIDIFLDGDNVLFVEFEERTKRSAVLERQENVWVTKINGVTWFFAGVVFITPKTFLFWELNKQIPNNWCYNDIAGTRPAIHE